MIYDISTPLGDSTPVYPGDPPVTVQRLSDTAAGDEFTLSQIAMSLHAGTHVDAPSHYLTGAASVDAMPLEVLIGPVVLAGIPSPGAVTAELLDQLSLPPAAARLLLRTQDTEQETALDETAAKWIVDCGVKLIGIDRMSIGLDSQCRQVHRILLASGVVILESLALSVPPPGQYKLICLPLNIQNAEAAPARAVLVSGEATGEC